MDFVMGMVSIMKDLNSVDRQYRNLNLQLKYTIDKANHILGKALANQSQIKFMVTNLSTRVKDAQQLANKLDELFNANTIAMKDRIRLTLPFDQTKNQIIKSMEILENAMNDIKSQMAEDTKVENKDGGVKKKLSESGQSDQQRQANQFKNTRNQLTVQQIDEHIEEAYQMGPTINDDQIQFSQTSKENAIQITISIQGDQSIISILEAQQNDLVNKKILLTEKQSKQENVLYTVARMNFQKSYPKLIKVTKDIDRMSTKGHFHIVLKKVGQLVKNDNGNQGVQPNILNTTNPLVILNNVIDGISSNPPKTQQNNSSQKKSTKIRISGSQKAQQQQFFSFPCGGQDKTQPQFQFVLLARKQDKSKILYRMMGEQWIKIQEVQIQILNGQKLAAFINPATKQPALYFQVTYQKRAI